MNVILCGYNWVGCRALELLLNENHNVYVYTSESPYYVPSLINFCKKKGIEYTTEKISLENLPFKPDIICSMYYRYIISQDIINICNGKIFNLHPALLPKYRGCSSLTWAMINGEKSVGYTYHYIDKNIDTGKIILQREIPIYDFDTQDTLYKRVMFDAIKDFNEVFSLVINNFEGLNQVGNTTFYNRGCPNSGQIDPCWPEDKIERFIRAMVSPPLPLAKYKDTEISTLDEYKEMITKIKEDRDENSSNT